MDKVVERKQSMTFRCLGATKRTAQSVSIYPSLPASSPNTKVSDESKVWELVDSVWKITGMNKKK